MFKRNKKEEVERKEMFFGEDDFIKVISDSECLPGNTQEMELLNSEIYVLLRGEYIPIGRYVEENLVYNEILDNQQGIDYNLLWLERNGIPDFCKKKILTLWNELQKEEDEIVSRVKEFKKKFKRW